MRKAARITDLVAKGMAMAVEVGECLEWQWHMGNHGKQTPVVKSREGKTYTDQYPVPRYLWEQDRGTSVPAGMVVYRKCCNNRCVNIDHITAGTKAQWMANRKKHGLTKHSVSTVLSLTAGARSRVNVKNSIEQAREVRRLLADHSREEVAALTGVSLAMVVDIARGKAWKDYANPFAGLLAANDSNRRAA